MHASDRVERTRKTVGLAAGIIGSSLVSQAWTDTLVYDIALNRPGAWRRNIARKVLFSIAAVLLGIAATVSPARAAYILTYQQVGSNVVATGSGSLDLTDLTLLYDTGGTPAQVAPSNGYTYVGATYSTGIAYFYANSGNGNPAIVGPTSFGTGSDVDATSSTDTELVGISGGYPAVEVPNPYTSGAPLSDTSTYAGSSISSLGLTPGTYVWTWGQGADADSFTLNIDSPSVPEPASLGLLAMAGFGILRRHRQSTRCTN